MFCCLCNREIDGYGHNPWPLMPNTDRCCDECNYTRVIPARADRMTDLYDQHREEDPRDGAG